MTVPVGAWELGSALIGGLFSAKGQSSANAQNLQIARENRAWQEKMSNTAYQRASADLEKAGLNRILALGSPASTPGGNVATMGNVGASAVEGASKGMQMSLSKRRLSQEIKNMAAQENMTKENATNMVLQRSLMRAQIAKTLYEANTAETTSKIIKREQDLANIDRKLYDKMPILRVIEKITGSAPIKAR